MKRRDWLFASAACALGSTSFKLLAQQYVPFTPYAARAEVREWAQGFVNTYGGSVEELMAVLSQAQSNETVIRLMQPAPQGFKRSWQSYRRRFVEPVRIKAGLRFWEAYSGALQRAEAKTGVAAQAIVGILGVETIFGRQIGDFRVLDALMTLSFDYLRRADFFRSELEHFLLLSRENGWIPTQILGSFAGAMGIPQFMPSSIRKHAVDFDEDKIIDLRNSPVDAIGSVAQYLADYGWEKGLPISLPATVAEEAAVQELLKRGPQANLTLDELRARGTLVREGISENTKLMLVDLVTHKQATEFRVGTANFYAITRYNKSFFYAAAVQDLGAAIASAKGS
ncbi:MAG: lytic murein transglycosylase B [Burkholderiaceae bacterium]|nr:lytic murein transglycosylase B [Burkholderiaceae bacterium]